MTCKIKALGLFSQRSKTCVMAKDIPQAPDSGIRGFTLIDMAVAFMVIGLLAMPMIQQYKHWQATKNRDLTNIRVQNINEAVENFYYENGRYPCPADPALTAADASYGDEYLDGAGTACNPALDFAPPANGTGYEGTVPFKALRLAVKDNLDGWNNKIIYAVTKTLSDPAGPFNNVGTLTVQQYPLFNHPVSGELVCADTTDELPNTFPGDPGRLDTSNVHYTILSLGETGIGATYQSGTTPQACPTGAGLPFEAENCNKNGTYLMSTCLTNTNVNTADPSFYDDIMAANANERNAVPSDIWDKSRASNDDMGSNVGLIGIGTEAPAYEVDVVGNIKADNTDITDTTKNGDVHATEFCNEAGTKCFNAKLIAGNEPAMNCNPLTQGMTGIGSNQAKCKVTYHQFLGCKCAAGEFMTAIHPGGICCNGVCKAC